MPTVEISYIQPVLDRLTSVAWYLDIDPITTIARFKEEPSINKIIAEEKGQIGNLKAKDHMRSQLRKILLKIKSWAYGQAIMRSLGNIGKRTSNA